MAELVNNSRPEAIVLSENDLKRFWVKVKKTEGCWIWTGAKNEQGYGLFRLPKHVLRAHRTSFEIYYGRLCGRWALHRCDNPSCVRPDHLFSGDARDNRFDADRKGRSYFTSRAKKLSV